MYEELVKRLREHGEFLIVSDRMKAPPNLNVRNVFAEDYAQAADTIEKLCKQLDDMNEANIALYGALPKWIPVTEQTPDEYTTILFITGGGDLRVGYYDGDHKSYCDMTEFRYMCTHWMPLPTPPKEET